MDNPQATMAAEVRVPPAAGSMPRHRLVFIGLGSLLIVAALLKAHQLATTPLPPSAWLSRAALAFVVQGELLLGLLLLFDVAPHWLWRISLCVFSVFAVVTLRKALLGYESCGCFGRVEISPWWTFFLDLAAVALLLRWPPDVIESPSLRRCARAAMIYLTLGVPVGIVIASYQPQTLGPGLQKLDGSELVLLEPEAWQAKKFPLTSYIDRGEQLRRGRWIVVLFHHDCPKCQQVLPRYERMAAGSVSKKDPQRVALIELPPFGPVPKSLGNSCLWSSLAPDYEWFVTTPVEIHLENGIVTKVVPDTEEVSRRSQRETGDL